MFPIGVIRVICGQVRPVGNPWFLRPSDIIKMVMSGNPSKTFYLETFGCQMNVHDSEKVAGALQSQGYTQVEDPAAADLVLYNTCSIRDKAEQKVFSRLGHSKHEAATGRKFGVLGCVAQQEGERIFEKAPHVSLVVGCPARNRQPAGNRPGHRYRRDV